MQRGVTSMLPDLFLVGSGERLPAFFVFNDGELIVVI
jgi:hypothetical protein